MKINRKFMIKTNTGITLIALVVTIIVLLILAGVSIQMLTGDNGILSRAGEAKNTTDEAQIKERIRLSYLAALTGGKGQVTEGLLVDELDKEFGINGYKLSQDLTKVTINGKDYEVGGTVTPGGRATKDKNGTKIATTTETTPFLPNPTKNEITNNDLSTGLTIKDEKQNEWVWIVVPKTDKVYKVAGVGQTLPAVPDNSENSIYTTIEADLRKYCETDKAGNALITQTDGTESTKDYNATTVGFVDEYVEGKGANINSAEKYKEYKQKMLKSVYENGGFYIGKYEAGYEGATKRGEAGATTQEAVIKQNAYPYNYVTNAQAEDLAEGFKTGEKTTTLMFGVQWDLVLRHLSELGVSTADLTSNSTEWGNYYDTKYNITNASAWYSTNYGESWTKGTYNKTSNGTILLTTGADSKFVKQNIYDLAGNVWEWTLEKTSYSNCPCSYRGGDYDYTGSSTPASERSGDNTGYSLDNLGFRVSLY